MVNYRIHVTEYGLHWNFFFTIAVVKFISELMVIVLRTNGRILAAGISIMALYQYRLIDTEFLNWMFNGERMNAFSQNKEGIFQCLGKIIVY